MASDDFEARWVREQVRARLFGEVRPVTLGRYALLEPIGRGGMGVVFNAQDPMLEREVAVKVLRTESGGDPRRLLREGRALAQLTHPNVVRVLDAGLESAVVYLVMERIEGMTLERWRELEAPGDEVVIDVMLAAGSGLAAAHAQGLVHRDVKPHNILIDADGNTWLTDFGLVGPSADSATLSSDAPPSEASPSLTMTGALLGTPAYMAPEQLDGRDVDARSDQFAFCVTFHQLLSGERPFEGSDLAELRGAMEAGALRRLAPERRWIGELLERGLAYEPSERYASLNELLDAIEARRESRRLTGAAGLSLDRLSRALEGGTLELPEIARLTAVCHEDLRRAREAWPGNEPARLALERVEELLEHVERARHERAHDPSPHDRYKQIWSLVVTVVWGVGYLAFGALTRFEIYPVGNVELTAFYAAFLALHVVVSKGTARDIHETNVATRKLSVITGLGYLANSGIAGLGALGGASVAMSLATIHVSASALWAAAAATADRRAFAITPFTAAAALAIVIWPYWCFEISAAAAWLGIGALAVAWRPDAPTAAD